MHGDSRPSPTFCPSPYLKLWKALGDGQNPWDPEPVWLQIVLAAIREVNEQIENLNLSIPLFL